MITWLNYAETHQETVHIIGHHPPNQCLVSFSWTYAAIVNRYRHIISGQFFGHTHYDEFFIYYDTFNSSTPVIFFSQ